MQTTKIASSAVFWLRPVSLLMCAKLRTNMLLLLFLDCLGHIQYYKSYIIYKLIQVRTLPVIYKSPDYSIHY